MVEINNLKYALWYREKKDFSIIPILPPSKDEKGEDCCKKPEKGFEWKKYQTEKPSIDDVKEWFSRSNFRIAIIAGKINNLCILDCDSEEAKQIVEEHLPDGIPNPTPIARTPRGGYHYYFQATDLPGRPNAMTNLDIRSEGNYIIAPPSQGLNGTGYSWQKGCGLHEVNPIQIPNALYIALKDIVLGGGYKGGDVLDDSPNIPQQATNATINHIRLDKGSRDESLFHIANHLVKGDMPQHEIEQLLYLIGTKLCDPPFPEREISTKIQSAFSRSSSRLRNISEEVREWVLTTKGHFLTTESHRELQLTTKVEKKACMMALLRMVEEGLVERYGNKRGAYRLIESQSDVIDWKNSETSPIKITMPLSMNGIVRFRSKTLNVIAGSQDSGKTALMLNIAMLNAGKHDIYYFSSEMDGGELRERLEKFDRIPIELFEKIKFMDRSSAFADVIQPDAVNIIDYLEISDNFFRIAEDFKNIRNRLKKGIAFIAIQKEPKTELGRGASFSMEKPRLYLTIDHEDRYNVLRIKKAKFWAKDDSNPRGMEMRFYIVNGVNLIPAGVWMSPEDYKILVR